MWNFLKKHVEKKIANPPDESNIPGVERRRTARINLLLTINCTLEGKSSTFQIMTENVNILGIKFVSLMALKKDQILVMQLLLQRNSAPINVKGRVVWCAEMEKNAKKFYEGGIEFSPLSKSDSDFFQKFIDTHTVAEMT
ncbi:MAG: PilZ domain-containing protein [Vulcanimicrobiota bacterium]